MLGQKGKYFSLGDLSRHNIIEHDRSIFHADAVAREEYAPDVPNESMLENVLQESKDGLVLTPDDLVRARRKREAEYGTQDKDHCLDFVHHEIAVGEMGFLLELFGYPSKKSSEHHETPHPPRSFLSGLLKWVMGGEDNDDENEAPPAIPVDVLRTFIKEERLPDGWKPTHTVTLSHTADTVKNLKALLKAAPSVAAKAGAPAVHPPVEKPAGPSPPVVLPPQSIIPVAGVGITV